MILSESCRHVFPSSLLTVPAFPPATRSTKACRRSGQGSADTVESPYPTLYTADKITYYTQWTLAKWAVPCKGSYILAMCKNRVSVGRWSPSGCKGFHIFYTNLIRYIHPEHVSGSMPCAAHPTLVSRPAPPNPFRPCVEYGFLTQNDTMLTV